jgi:hypothetical protein
MTIPLYYCKSRVPLVMFRMSDGQVHVGIVDTGSEVSMFDASLIGQGMRVIDDEKMTNFVGVNGDGGTSKVTQLEGTIGLKSKDGELHDVPVSGVTYDFTNLTAVFRNRIKKNITISAILGADFLKEYNAKIDFKNKTLTIDYEQAAD